MRITQLNKTKPMKRLLLAVFAATVTLLSTQASAVVVNYTFQYTPVNHYTLDKMVGPATSVNVSCGDVLYSGGSAGIEVEAFKNMAVASPISTNNITMSVTRTTFGTVTTSIATLPKATGFTQTIAPISPGSTTLMVTDVGVPSAKVTRSISTPTFGFATYRINFNSGNTSSTYGSYIGYRPMCINSIGYRYLATVE